MPRPAGREQRAKSLRGGKLRGDGRAGQLAAVDVELSKRCFQVTRTVKFAKMAKKFHSDSAKTPGLRVTPPRMPKLQRAKLGRFGVHFRIRPLFLRTDFLKLKKNTDGHFFANSGDKMAPPGRAARRDGSGRLPQCPWPPAGKYLVH